MDHSADIILVDSHAEGGSRNDQIDRAVTPISHYLETAGAVIENFKEDLGVRGGRLYERRDGGYELTRTFGGTKEIQTGIFVPDSYPPVQAVIDEGVVVMDLTAPGIDPEFERRLDADRFAAIVSTFLTQLPD